MKHLYISSCVLAKKFITLHKFLYDGAGNNSACFTSHLFAFLSSCFIRVSFMLFIVSSDLRIFFSLIASEQNAQF